MNITPIIVCGGLLILVLGFMVFIHITDCISTKPKKVDGFNKPIKEKPKTKTVTYKGIKCKEDNKYYIIHTNTTSSCPFCASRNIFSGSWTPESCKDCGASHMLGVWLLEKK